MMIGSEGNNVNIEKFVDLLQMLTQIKIQLSSI